MFFFTLSAVRSLSSYD